MKDEDPKNQPSNMLVAICGGIALLIGLWWDPWFSSGFEAKAMDLLLTWGGGFALLSGLVEEFR